MHPKSSPAITVLDYIDNITVPGDVFEEPVNEYWALTCLRHGMDVLYRQTLQYERIAKEIVNPNSDKKVYLYGNSPIYNEVPATLLTCLFHWYAISACQYVKTIGAIAFKLNTECQLPKEYANRIIPEVVAFRDKVAAHFAWTTNHKLDNDAERLASILPQLTFKEDSFYVADLTIYIKRGSHSSNSNSIQPWSLSKVHESLCKRYWPQPKHESSAPASSGLSDTDHSVVEQ